MIQGRGGGERERERERGKGFSAGVFEVAGEFKRRLSGLLLRVTVDSLIKYS